MKLYEYLEQLDSDEFVQVGSKSSYYFAGTSAEYFRDLPAMTGYYRRLNKKKWTPLESRKVLATYTNEYGKVVLTTGNENGLVWLPEEYKKALKSYQRFNKE